MESACCATGEGLVDMQAQGVRFEVVPKGGTRGAVYSGKEKLEAGVGDRRNEAWRNQGEKSSGGRTDGSMSQGRGHK